MESKDCTVCDILLVYVPEGKALKSVKWSVPDRKNAPAPGNSNWHGGNRRAASSPVSLCVLI